MLDFTNEEYKFIINIIRRCHLDYSLSSEFVEIRAFNEFIEIVKLKDDWFTIFIEPKLGSNEFYLCDEFEEVQAFLLKRYRKKLI